MPSASSTMRVTPSTMSALINSMRWNSHDSFNNIEMAAALGLSAVECHAALQSFVAAELITFDRLDTDGIESWRLSKTGEIVWQANRIHARVTAAKVKEFLKCMPFIVSALSKNADVLRILVGGAWVLGHGYGPFLIGIEVEPGALTPMEEMRLIEAALQFANTGDVLDQESPVVLVFSKVDAGVPHRLQSCKVVYQAGQPPVKDIESAPVAIENRSDINEQLWGARLEAFASICGFDADMEAFHQALWDSMSHEDQNVKPVHRPFRELPLAKQMIHCECEVAHAPSRCSPSQLEWPGDGVAISLPDPKLLAACREMFATAAEVGPEYWLPDGWQEAAAHADYWYSCGRPQGLQADEILSELLPFNRTRITAWMDPDRAPDVLHALAVGANEFREAAKAKKVERGRQKRQTTTAYIALFDITRPQPECYALVRQPTGNQGNIKAALDFYSPFLIHQSQAAQAIYEMGYFPAALCTVKRMATDDEVALFQSIASQQKRAVGFLLELQGETTLGFKRGETTTSSVDLRLRSLPMGAIAPIPLFADEEDKFQDAIANMPKEIALRMRKWWAFPCSTPMIEVAKACLEGPEKSLLARLVDPTREFEFEKMPSPSHGYAASIAGEGWRVRIEGICNAQPPIVIYAVGDSTSNAQLQLNPYRTWRGVMDEITQLLRSFILLKQIGILDVVAQYRNGKLQGVEDEMAQFEALLNELVTARLFRGYEDNDYFSSPYSASFGLEAQTKGLGK
ncbi:hypothetical protein D9M73_51720 [compost metagenome]|uniref:Uncharacterized protein n=1 Tax=Polaromonas aquatica TaxID=332657 RepID=A0ABW1TVV7_9BURK